MLASLFEFNPGAHVLMLCDADVPQDDRRTLEKWASERGCVVECITPRAQLPDSLPGLTRLTRAAWLRLFLPQVASHLDRIIYLDVDLCVRASLRELWDLDLKGNWVAAVTDVAHIDHITPLYQRVGFPDASHYFNSGVLLMDLQRFRVERVAELALRFAADHPEQVLLADQDPLNAVLSAHRQPLALRWNALAPLFEGGIVDRDFPFSAEEARLAREQPAIVHFSGPWKPWHVRSRHPLRRLYGHYRGQTPWPEWQPDGRTLKHRFLRILPENWERKVKGLYSQARASLPGLAK